MKIALIGSSRFIDLYHKANKTLTLQGHVVYSIATISTQSQPHEITDEEKELLDLVHLLKIQESDAVFLVTDETGYLGTSTKREVRWATLLDKQIFVPKGHDLALQGIGVEYAWLFSYDDRDHAACLQPGVIL